MNTELENALLAVRNSFRLVHDYQRRVLDTVQFIADQFGMPIVAGYTLFVDDPMKNNKRIIVDNSAWEWLPMYSYEFLLKNTEPEPEKITFALAFQADTGYYDSTHENARKAPEQFIHAEESKSFVYFYLGVNSWKPAGFEKCWSSKSSDEFQAFDSNGQFVSKRFPMSRFDTEDNINDCLGELRNYFESFDLGNQLTTDNIRPVTSRI